MPGSDDATDGPVTLFRWLARLTGRAAPPMPVLVRVLGPEGTPVGSVHLEARWHPSGGRTSTATHTAQGLCLLPWRGEEARATVRIRSTEGVAELVVHRDRPDADRVVEVRLDPGEVGPWPAEPGRRRPPSERPAYADAR